jgi:protein-tyrosine-phosphatase
VSVLRVGEQAAWEAKAAIESIGGNLENHKATPIGSVAIDEFDYVIALDPKALLYLRERSVRPSKVLDACVDDPYGGDERAYEDCADAISRKLDELLKSRA